MRQHRREPDQPRLGVDRGGLHGRDLMPAQALAHELQPPRERGIAKAALSPARDGEGIVAAQDFSGLASSACALASAAALAPMLWLGRAMAGLPTREREADRARAGALGPEPVPDRLPGVLGHERLQLGLGALMLGVCGPGP